MSRPHPVPSLSAQIGLDFWIESRKLWAIDLPLESMSIAKLAWNLMFERWEYDPVIDQHRLTPFNLLLNPHISPKEFKRTQQANLSYPIEIIWRHNRWVVMDGLHRLLKAFALGHQTILVRKFYPKHIPLIDPEYDAS